MYPVHCKQNGPALPSSKSHFSDRVVYEYDTTVRLTKMDIVGPTRVQVIERTVTARGEGGGGGARAGFTCACATMKVIENVDLEEG